MTYCIHCGIDKNDWGGIVCTNTGGHEPDTLGISVGDTSKTADKFGKL